jgi:hemoglobin/transferrin/lactoferrin receptor protein
VYSSAPPRPGQQPLDSIIEVKLLTDTRQNVKSYGWDVQTNFLLSSRNILTAGASWFYDHSRDSRISRADAGIIGFATRAPAPPTFIPVPRIPFGPPATTFPQRVPVAKFKNLGLFVQDEYDVNRWLRFVGGLRVDRFDINTANTPGYLPLTGIADATPTVDASKLPSATGESFNRTRVSGDIGVIVRPQDYLSFSARVGRSLRHPNLEELLFSGPATVGNIIPNIKVQPETGINVDLGARVRTARYAASLSYFNNTYSNFISTEIVAVSQSVGPLSQAINFAKVRISGFEFDVERPFAARSMTITPVVTVGYLRGTFLESVNPLNSASLNGQPLNKISPLKAVVGVRWQDKLARWWSEYNVRAHAKVERVSPLLTGSPFITAQDIFGLPGFNVHTLRGGYNFQRERGRVALTLGLENFTNQYYREQFQFAPARGRSFTVGLLLKYF